MTSRFGVIVMRAAGEFTAIPDGDSLAIGFGRLYVRDRRKREIAIFEPGEWKFAARCDRDQIAVASSTPALEAKP